MADDKWISGLRGDMAVGEAARRILTVRLGAVLDRLPGAIEHADDDIEHVHQLRVATRRAAAAVRIFADSLGAKLHRKTRRTLRAIRRAAGSARDWDVFLEMLRARTEQINAKGPQGIDFLFGLGHGQRMSAQTQLDGAIKGQAERLRQRLTQVGAALDEHVEASSLSDLAVPLLTQQLREFEDAARADLHAYEALHQVRILGKQFRYAMELFECCFAPAFRNELYPKIAEMQEILGRANDSHVAAQRLEELRYHLQRAEPAQWTRCRAAVEQLERYHHRRLPAQRRLFMKWWGAWQSAGHATALIKLLHT
jgi:CHAD domain-containing protein